MSERRELEQRYKAEWNNIVNFMKNNTGFTLSGIARGGSRVKGTHRDDSDLDIIFSISRDPLKTEIYPILLKKLQENFLKNTIGIGSSYGVIKMSVGPLKFDIILKKLVDFNSEIQNNKISRL